MIDVENETATYDDRRALVDWGILLGTLDARCRAVGEFPHWIRLGRVYDTLYSLGQFETWMKETVGVDPPIVGLPPHVAKLRELGFKAQACRYRDPEIEQAIRDHILENWR